MRRKRQLDIDSEVLTELYELEFESEVNRSSREYIKWIQSSLNKILGFRLKVDGFIGPKTRSAIRSFQLRNNLKADGIVGPKTEAALVRAGASQPHGNNAPLPVIPPPVISPNPGAGAVPAGKLRSNLVSVANLQWNAWGNGSKKEYDAGMDNTIKRYWEEGVGVAFPGVGVPWSAAFISWVVKEAGGGANFRYSGAHSTYTYYAKQNRLQNNSNPFKAYRITEKKPEPGDIIVQNRGSSTFTYDNLQPDKSGTHGDIVVKVNATTIEVIGGNLGDSVSKNSNYRLNSSGFLQSSAHFAIIKIDEQATQNEGENEFELISEFFGETSGATSEMDRIKSSIANGERNENVLSDMIFFARHPELGGRPLYKGQTGFASLSQEWLAIRDNMVRPSLSTLPSGSSSISSSNQNCTTLDQFKFGKYSLLPAHYRIINGIVVKLIASQSSTNSINEIILTGYTDPKGSERFNLTLGQKRGDAVANAIKAKIKKDNPNLLSRITIRVQSKGESELISTTDNSKNRRVVVCMNAKEGSSVNTNRATAKVVAKSFIMHIGNNIGDLNSTLRCQLASGVEGRIPIIGPIIGASPNTKLSVLAARTDQMFNGGENPQNDVKDKQYRMFSSITFTVLHDGNSITSVVSTAPETDVGVEPVATEIGIAFTPPELVHYSRPKLTRVNPTYYSFQWGFKGRPPVIAEPGFQAICPRTSVYIWHEIYGGIVLKDGVVKTVARIIGSEFPSHRVWVDGETNDAMFKAQGPFSNLWVSSEKDFTLVKEYEFV